MEEFGFLGDALRKLTKLGPLSRTTLAVRTIVRRSTPRRVLNLALVETEYRLRRTRLRGRPYILVVDPLNVCNLRCPLCPTGLLRHGRRQQFMPWDTYTGIIDQLAPWAYKVNLFNWGEPLLHPHIVEMIRFANSRRLGTALSSNLSVEISDEMIDALVESGLDLLCASIDGVTRDTYERYRRRGDLETVLANVRRLVERKRALGKGPTIEWQFIVMRQNQHELPVAREHAKRLGVPFRVIPVTIPFGIENAEELAQQWVPVGAGRSGVPEKSACQFLYRYFVLNPDSRTSPCCRVSGEATDFGEWTGGGFEELWNNALYVSARAHYRKGAHIAVATVCDGCELYEKRARYSAKGATDRALR